MSSRQVDAKLADDIGSLVRSAMKRSIVCCPNCEHFDTEPIVKCKLNGQRPPSTIIAFGCEMFKNNDCPF